MNIFSCLFSSLKPVNPRITSLSVYLSLLLIAKLRNTNPLASNDKIFERSWEYKRAIFTMRSY